MQGFILENLITLLIVIYLLYGLVKGFRSGLLKLVLSLGSLIVTIIITRTFTPAVASIVKDVTNIESTLTEQIYNAFITTNTFDSFNLNLFNIQNTGELNETIKNTICSNYANIIINIMSGVGLFIASIIVLKFVIKVLDIVDYIPMVGQLNKILGAVAGVAQSLIIIWIIMVIVRVFENMPQVQNVIRNIQKSPIAWSIYTNNVIYDFLANLFPVFK